MILPSTMFEYKVMESERKRKDKTKRSEGNEGEREIDVIGQNENSTGKSTGSMESIGKMEGGGERGWEVSDVTHARRKIFDARYNYRPISLPFCFCERERERDRGFTSMTRVN